MSEKLLLSTVFKPFGIDDMYGRKENIPELLIAQITRVQGIFTPRMWHANSGLHIIAANCGIDTTVLEWPSIEEFISEIQATQYDYIGINFIPCTVSKMKKMSDIIKKYSPNSKIIIGGQGTILPDIDSYANIDYICKGDGIRFIRNLTKKDKNFKFIHPVVISNTIEFFGLPSNKTFTGQIATGLGCRNGCDFCVTSSFFDCVYQPFLMDGKELYDLIKKQSVENKLKDFWLIDENFLQEEERARQLLKAVNDDSGNIPFYNLDMVWSSAENISLFTPKEIAEMGITTLWIGYESKLAGYKKNKGIDIKTLVNDLSLYGITTLLSFVMFYDFHDKETLSLDLNDFYDTGQAYSQFIPLSAYPGTPLYEKIKKENRLIDYIPWEERHGLTTSIHKHPFIPIWEQEKLLMEAYHKEYELNGPSLLRIFRTRLKGYETFINSDSLVLKKKAGFLKDRLISHSIWVIASRELVKKEHIKLVDEILYEFKNIFGVDVYNENIGPAKFMNKMINNEIIKNNGKDVNDLQPEMKKTNYKASEVLL